MKNLIIVFVFLCAGICGNAQTFRGAGNSFQSFITSNHQLVQSTHIHAEPSVEITTQINSIQTVINQEAEYAKDGVIQEEIVAGVIQEELNAGRKTNHEENSNLF